MIRTSFGAGERDLLAGEDQTLELAEQQQATTDLAQEAETEKSAAPTDEPAASGANKEAPPNAPPQPIAARALQDQGKVLQGRYRLQRAVAIGGSSIVYRATDLHAATDPGRPASIAVKIVRPDMRHRSVMGERLQREFGYTASLHHSNIVRVLDLDTHEVPFFTMEYLEGEPLNARLQRQQGKTLPPAEALRILRQCGAALAYAHEQGILHCDFKPSNVFLTSDGNVKVLDFGAACAFTSDLGSNIKKPESATPAYASPQLLAAERADVRDDVFSLACVAYELFAGRHPFGGLSAVEMFTRGKALVRPDSLSDTRWHAVESALRIEREARPASIAAFLDAFAEHRAVAATRTAPSRNLFLPAVVLLALGIAIGSWFESKQPVKTASTGQKARTTTAVDMRTIEQAIASHRATIPSALALDTLQRISPLFSAAANSVSFTASRMTAAPTLSRPVSRSVTIAPAAVSKKPKPLTDSMVTLEQPRLEVSGRSVAAVLTVRRTGTPNGRVLVQWRTQGGTARPSQDYEPIADGAVWLADGQSTRALFIPLKQATNHGSRTFTVELKDAKGAALGGITRAVVTIR